MAPITIQDLLNPMPEVSSIRHRIPRSSSATLGSSLEREKKPKMAKDSAVFRKGNTQGEVRYPPCEVRSPELARIHREFKLHPFGSIAEYPRHIPYQSEKKSFQEKTGRDSFHVFQYTFQIPGEDQVWTVMWDYNIGLVRTTHLFKCMNHTKTAPGRVLSRNQGLREICHSITGGALAAQGYWMPFEAAKAITATFCWNIRHVLTPLFGIDFPAMCTPPADRTHNFEHAIIDPAIVQKCTELANYYRSLELQSNHSSSRRPSPASSLPPSLMDHTVGYRSRHVPPRPSRPFNKVPRRSYADSVGSARDSSSEPYCMSPTSPTRGGFTPVNAPRSSVVSSRVPSPTTFLKQVVEARKRKTAANTSGESESEADVSSTLRSDVLCIPPSPLLIPNHESMPDGYLASPSANSMSELSDSDESMASDEESVHENDDDEDYHEPGTHMGRQMAKLKKNPVRSAKSRHGGRTPHPSVLAHEVKAAHALLRLHMQNGARVGSDVDEPMRDPNWGPPLRSRSQATPKRRRASL
ncbi:hypothetical protein N7492_009637 [Penicillium capsulatum]|uniref:HTH APSES-type domain-containing protein n=1 Tax=Penicillium capsulatum TaxID=69766 RepID=A0A9W9HUW4_9EURO|nr:hypothetical protein N7492_009637 [Penicillium capsulatum]KAJ6107023.1 hypothetical protein N7512_010540 [Penicillium capsulatum]